MQSEESNQISYKRAMEGDVPLESVYGHRLVTVNPTQEQVRAIAKYYRETVIPEAKNGQMTLEDGAGSGNSGGFTFV